MQMPTLIEALAARPERSPLPPSPTVPAASSSTLSLPSSSRHLLDELGSRLVNFARSRNVGMGFVVPSSPVTASSPSWSTSDSRSSSGEAAKTGTHHKLSMVGHQIPEESGGDNSRRVFFLKEIRSLDPNLVVIVDERG
ncbi:hypothetical protein HPP92_007527 [Vanilla planifolia]|uniref:Uncharacterized protein n=1 Tax=Vanilla planifolia TaxID=51239 RepID=A0A835RKF8_VANPL|nr:hypothetical protein HPP92_007751 [Vanilla planifolia]KAG0490664.1 hypothetical protein HPP92_007527 [Vanilla planifolia]